MPAVIRGDTRLSEDKGNPVIKKPLHAPLFIGGKPYKKGGAVEKAMGGTVQTRPKGSSPRPGEKPFSPGMPKLPRIKMAMGGMTLRPGDVTNKPPRVPPRVSGGPTRLPPGMTAPSPRSQSQGMGMAAADKGMYGAMGLKKGGMATKKKAGKISEYGGKEMYSSKKGMMKHEGMESMKMEKSEGKMKQGGMAKKGRGMAIMIAIGKPKGRGKS